MAAVVAPAEPVTTEPSPREDEDRPLDENEPDQPHDDLDEDEEEHEEGPAKEWDEGGKSHCGYNEMVHETLMKIGEAIHKVVGEPSDTVYSAMKGIGNWFQEASYAARDVQRGNMDVAQETVQAIKSMVTGDEDDRKDAEEGEINGEGDRAETVEAPKLV
jgi:hypothetical protein